MYQIYFESLATKEILERFALEKESLDKKLILGLKVMFFQQSMYELYFENISDQRGLRVICSWKKKAWTRSKEMGLKVMLF
jgi:hypothetical protein